MLRGQKGVTFLPKCKEDGSKMATDTKFAGVSFYSFYFQWRTFCCDCRKYNIKRLLAVEHSHNILYF